jgi:hypothetical protein
VTRILAAAALGALLAASPAAQTVDHLTIVAPAAPGGGWDQTARALQHVVDVHHLARVAEVQNVPGAAGTIGLSQFVDAQRPGLLDFALDGNTRWANKLCKSPGGSAEARMIALEGRTWTNGPRCCHHDITNVTVVPLRLVAQVREVREDVVNVPGDSHLRRDPNHG